MTASRVAALYDIHGNLPALEAVLAEVEQVGVDAVVVGGDVVPGPLSAACLERLRNLAVPVEYLRGNGERSLAALLRGEPLVLPESVHDTMRWVLDRLDPSVVAELGTWPLTVSLEVEGLGSVLFCHATPDDDDRIFTRITPEERLRLEFEGIDAPMVVCGHTHMQFDRRVGPIRVINAGSVGAPFGIPGAYWLLIDRRELLLRRTEYDYRAAKRSFEAAGYPDMEGFDVESPASEEAMLELFEGAALR